MTMLKFQHKNDNLHCTTILSSTNNAENAFAIKDYTASCCIPHTIKAIAVVNEACDELLICHKVS